MRNRIRFILFILVLILFAVIFSLAISDKNIEISEQGVLHLGLVFFLVPISIALNALELQLCAKATNRSMRLNEAYFISSVATIMNILPLPGSTMIRAAALIKLGVNIVNASSILAAAAAMWLLMAFGITSLYLLEYPVSVGVFLLSSIAILLIGIWIARISTTAISVGFVASRVAMLLLFIMRLYLVFIAIGSVFSAHDAIVLSLAGVLGSAISIIPAGLGVVEGLGALIARINGSDPASAFIVLAINRFIGYFGNGLILAYYGMFRAEMFKLHTVRPES